MCNLRSEARDKEEWESPYVSPCGVSNTIQWYINALIQVRVESLYLAASSQVILFDMIQLIFVISDSLRVNSRVYPSRVNLLKGVILLLSDIDI